MYSALQIPIQVIPFIKVDGAGDKIFGDVVDTVCYAEGAIRVVTNLEGREVVSNLTLYLNGEETLTKYDEFIFDKETYQIKALNAVRDKTGIVKLWVVNV